MTASEIPISCERARLLLEAFIDAELSPVREARLDLHLSSCANCQAELQEARTALRYLRSLPTHPFPQERTAAILAQLPESETEEHAPTKAGWLGGMANRIVSRGAGFLQPRVWRPAFASLGVLATAALIALLAQESERSRASAEELAQAERDARWALAYVSQVTSRSSRNAMYDVMDRVAGDTRDLAVKEVLGGVMSDTGHTLVHETMGNIVTGPGDRALRGVFGRVFGGVIAEQVMAPVTDAVTRPLKEERRP